MKYENLQTRERLELEWTKDRLAWLAEQIEDMEGNPNYDADMWELRNRTMEVAAVFYNLHHSIYPKEKV